MIWTQFSCAAIAHTKATVVTNNAGQWPFTVAFCRILIHRRRLYWNKLSDPTITACFFLAYCHCKNYFQQVECVIYYTLLFFPRRRLSNVFSIATLRVCFNFSYTIDCFCYHNRPILIDERLIMALCHRLATTSPLIT